MMKLTLPWLMPQAIPIWVWLALVRWLSSTNSCPMARSRSAVRVSSRCQNESGITIKSWARPGMPSWASIRVVHRLRRARPGRSLVVLVVMGGPDSTGHRG